MSKKNKKQLNQILSRQRDLSAQAPVSTIGTVTPVATNQNLAKNKVGVSEEIIETGFAHDVRRTAINTLIVALLMAGAYTLGQRTDLLKTLGDKLFVAFGLN